MAAWKRSLCRRKEQRDAVALGDAWGRVVAEDVLAPRNVPAFDRSRVDGFAVHAKDTFGAEESTPIRLPLSPVSIPAGIAPDASLVRGEAMAIATGGAIPRGANAVVMVEDTSIQSGHVVIRRASVPGAHIGLAGGDLTRGELVVAQGTRLSARETGMLAACGLADVMCLAPYRVAVLSTGDEIVVPGQPLTLGQVHDVNGVLITDALREMGAMGTALGVVGDNETLLRDALKAALSTYDAVLLSGGTSKGEGDLTYRVVESLGEVAAHGLALKPGKPLCLAAVEEKPVAILPGFPTSAIFTFHTVVAPVLSWCMGSRHARPHTVTATLSTHLRSVVGRAHCQLVTLLPRAGELLAVPLAKGSGAVTAFARAEGFVEIPQHQEYVEAGTRVTVTLTGMFATAPELTIAGSHCLGVEAICAHLRANDDEAITTKTMTLGSRGGLAMIAERGCDIAPTHLLDPATNTWNAPFVPENCRLLQGYKRAQVIAFRPEHAAQFASDEVDRDLKRAFANGSLRLANRNPGSGTRALIDAFLAEHSVAGSDAPGWSSAYRSHTAVAGAISSGRADFGVCLSSAAEALGLHTRPWRNEQLDFAVRNDAWDEPGVAAFREALSNEHVMASLIKLGCKPR